jgi:Ca2+-binding RTX toxin-like protein
MFRSSFAARLNLETLGTRDVPAIFFNSATGVLDIEGTSNNDTAIVEERTDLFGAPTVDVRLVTVDAAGILHSEFRWFYLDDVTRIEFHGGDGNDVLAAASFRVLADGGSGNDRLSAIGQLSGGAGNDVIIATATSRRNVLDGGADNDVIIGSENSDTIHGGTGNDTIRGRGAQDFLYGDAGDDFIRAGAGDDWVYAGTGFDVVYGELGRDNLFGQADGDFIDGGDGADNIFGDALFPQADDGADWLLGGAGLDHIYAGGGNDFVDGGSDLVNDVIFLGPGRDTYAVYPIGYRDSAGHVVVVVAQDQFLDSGGEDIQITRPLRVV